MRSLLAALVLSAAAVPGAGEDAASFEPRLPKLSGPNRVGTRVLRLVDDSRGTPEVGNRSKSRHLTVQLWYPAGPEASGQRAPYLAEPGLLKAMQDEEYMNLGDELLTRWGELRTHAVAEAPLADGGPWPLLIASHGFGVARANYTSFVEDLASHGYVVAAIDHPYLGLTVLPEGKVLSTSVVERGEELAALRVRAAALDASHVLDALLVDDRAANFLAGRVDGERVGMFGHSLGGTAALEACLNDQRLKACANLDGYPFGAIGEQGVTRPFLVLLSKPTPPGEPLGQMGLERRELWIGLAEKHPSPAYLLTVSNTMHLSFSDFHSVVPSELLEKAGAAISAETLLGIVSRSLRAFFGHFLELVEREGIESSIAGVPEASLEIIGKNDDGVNSAATPDPRGPQR